MKIRYIKGTPQKWYLHIQYDERYADIFTVKFSDFQEYGWLLGRNSTLPLENFRFILTDPKDCKVKLFYIDDLIAMWYPEYSKDTCS